jgi:small subunit ribosomal protein S16
MAVVIRMRRTGRKNRPCFRINVTDSRFPRDGRLLETIGLYDPIRKDPAAQLTIDVERARHWLKNGAKPSETVTSIFRTRGVFEPKPIVKRERPGRKKPTKARERRDKLAAERAARKAERAALRKKERRAKKKAAAKPAEAPAPA